MVTGFEEQTKQLSEYELQQVHFFIKSFKSHIGKDNKITSAAIEMHYRNIGKKINSSRVRAIIHHIRYHETIVIGGRKYFLISDTTGYWLSCDKEEITQFAESLNQRASSILSIKQAADLFLGIAPAQKFLEDNQRKLF